MRDVTSVTTTRVRFWMGPCLFLVALTVYLITLSIGAFPGESARYIVHYTGLDPFMPLDHPVWGFFARIISRVPVGSFAGRLNVFSALCGAASVWLLYAIVSGIKHDRTHEELNARFSPETAQIISGVFGALYLTVSLPFWTVSTRAHPLTFGIALLLSAFFLLLRFGRSKGGWNLYLSLFLYGLGLTEFATFIPWAPFYAILLLYFLWRISLLKKGMLVPLLLPFLAGLVVYFLFAWRFAHSPSYAWQLFDGYFQVLRIIWREQLTSLSAGIPQVGWLIVAFMSFAPWLVVIGGRVPGYAPSGRGTWFGTHILYAVLSVLAVAAALNTSIAPWTLTFPYVVLATPSVVIAMWAGYVAGFWYVMLSKKSRNESRTMAKLRLGGRWLYVAAMAALIVVSAAKSLPLADGRTSRGVQRMAGDIIERLQGRTWMISGGPMDDNIVIAAREKNIPLTLISSTRGNSSAYGRYVGSLFKDARLTTLAHIGLSPLINAWFASDSNIAEKVTVLTTPDVWLSANMDMAPDQVLFLGTARGATADVDRIVRDEISFLDGDGKFIRAEALRKNPAQRWNQWAVRQIGKVANNLGVFLEDRNRSDLAFDLYRRARSMDTNNLSALINLDSLARKEGRPEKDSIDAELAAEIKRESARAGLWLLSQEFGYVRTPELYTRRGWAWAMSGKPNVAVNDMKHALELSGDNPDVQLALARLYLAQHEMGQSEAQYLAVLNKDPRNPTALLGLSRLATFKGDYDAARGYLAKLKDEKASPSFLRLEEAVLESSAGNVEKAGQLIGQVLQDEPANPKALMVMAVIALQSNDQDKLEAALAKLNASKLLPPGIRLAAARLALNQGNRKAAREHLDALLREQPLNADALQLLLHIDVYERQKDLAEEHAEQLVRTDPDNAYGNLMTGIFQSMKEEYSLAESSYRVSLASQRTDTVLNQLAWVLVKKGKLDEAYPLIKEALTMSDSNGSAWDTLGEIDLLRGNLDEAESAFQKALGFKPDDANIVLHMAQLLEKKGMYKESLRLANSLLTRPTDLGRVDYEDLRALVKRLRLGT